MIYLQLWYILEGIVWGARSSYFRGSGFRKLDKNKYIHIYRGSSGVGWEAPEKGLFCSEPGVRGNMAYSRMWKKVSLAGAPTLGGRREESCRD